MALQHVTEERSTVKPRCLPFRYAIFRYNDPQVVFDVVVIIIIIINTIIIRHDTS
jgi:hypothetical protein